MGIFRQLLETTAEKVSKSKEDREAEEAFVLQNEGTKAICAFMVYLFDKGNPGYVWVKENRVGLYPVISEDSVALCYMQPGDGQSFSGIKPKDVVVSEYSFQEMYSWYNLEAGSGYERLTSRTQLNALEQEINSEVQKLPHIKYNIGYMVRMFQ